MCVFVCVCLDKCEEFVKRKAKTATHRQGVAQSQCLDRFGAIH